MQSTTLATIINRMDRYQDVSTIEEQYKVRDIDEALRTLRRGLATPWTIKKSTLRVFSDVFVYPVASDHDVLAYLDNTLQSTSGTVGNWTPNANFVYTSLQQFYENCSSRNKLVEIWQGGDKYLGIKYNWINATSAQVSSPTLANYTASAGAGSLALNTVITTDGQDSVQFTVSSSPATITEALSSISLSDYKSRYYFRWIYLASVPTSISLRYGNDSSNYLSASVTTQFAGQAFVANDWNLVAFDLNTATVTGTIDSTAFDYSYISLVGPTSGIFYLGPEYLRQWQMMDYWYYSFYNVQTVASTVLDQDYFYDDTANTYSLDDSLVGPPEWIDVITFDAIKTSLSDNKNKDVIVQIAEKRRTAWDLLNAKYPDMSPVIITQRWNFGTEYPYSGFSNNDIDRIY